MRVGEVARNIYLVGLDVAYQLPYNLNVFLAHGQFLDLARLVERQVEEMDFG